LDSLETVALIILSVFLALVCYWVAEFTEREPQKREASVTSKEPREEARNIRKNHHFRTLLKKCFSIACIIFFTGVLSEFSVRMFFSGTDVSSQISGGIIGGLIAIPFITFLMLILLWSTPDLKKTFYRIFGED
jgi:hypothetical protein